MLRVGERLGADWSPLSRAVNKQLADDLAITRFVTLFYGLLDPAAHVLRYFSAGQAPLLHYHAADNRIEWLDATTMPFGIIDPLPDSDDTLLAGRFHLAPGDMIVLLTDGYYEAMNANDDQFGEPRVAEAIKQHAPTGPEKTLDALEAALSRFVGHVKQNDDQTAVLIQRISYSS
jgi:phosphoserine phosphatase